MKIVRTGYSSLLSYHKDGRLTRLSIALMMPLTYVTPLLFSLHGYNNCVHFHPAGTDSNKANTFFAELACKQARPVSQLIDRARCLNKQSMT